MKSMVELDKMMPWDEGTIEVLKDLANTAYYLGQFSLLIAHLIIKGMEMILF